MQNNESLGVAVDCLCPHNSYVETPPPDWMVFGVGTSENWLVHEDRVLMNGNCALIKESPERSLALFVICGHTKLSLSMN